MGGAAGVASSPAPLKTQPLAAPGKTAQLPKATVPLGTQQLGQPTGTGMQTAPGTIAGFDEEDDAVENTTLTSVLAIFASVAAAAALVLQVLAAKTWVDSTTPEPREFAQYFELES